jgi:hypothetical protein
MQNIKIKITFSKRFIKIILNVIVRVLNGLKVIQKKRVTS